MVEGIAEVLHHPVAVYIRVHFTGWIYSCYKDYPRCIADAALLWSIKTPVASEMMRKVTYTNVKFTAYAPFWRITSIMPEPNSSL